MSESPTVESRQAGNTTYVFLVCVVAALGGLLFGYDTGVINGAIGPLKAHFTLDAKWEGWATGCALLGCALGAGAAGALSDRFGRKKVLILAAVMFLISAIGTAVPRAITAFIIFRIIGGVGVGAASISSPMYIAEISPARMRGRLVSVNQFAIVSGFLVVYFANYLIGAHGVRVDEQAVRDIVGQISVPSVAGRESLQDHLTTVTATEMAGHYGIGRPEVAENLSRDILIRAAVTWTVVEPLEDRPRLQEQLQPEVERILRADISDSVSLWRQPARLTERIMTELKGVSVADPRVSSEEVHRQLQVKVREFAESVASNVSSFAEPVGAIVAAISQRRIEAWNVARGWRWMFGSESLPAVLLLVLLFLVPESPRWLTKQGRSDEALAILTRVDGTAYAQTELAEVLQQVTGINVFLYFGTEIFKKMGSGTNAALLQTVIVGAVNLTFTVIAIWTVDKLGRRPLMMIGSAGMGVSLAAMGIAAYAQATGLWMLLFILGYIACFALSVGPVTWVILSEIFPTRIRGRAMAIATVCLWIANYIVSQTFPMMDENPRLLALFHRAFPFWVYGAFCVVLLLFVAALVPETKGKTLEQIERHWLG